MNRWKTIKNVVVVGLGVTGLSVVNHLKKLPKRLLIRVIDTRMDPPGKENLPDSIELNEGGWNCDWLFSADIIVVNPGVSLSTIEIKQAVAQGIPVVGDIELFAWQVINKPIIAITGSNGKSTVADLTGKIAKENGLKVAVGGNIGTPALDLIEDEVELYVLEISSFQLETTSSLQLVAAAFLNFSEDHLDRYRCITDYRQAKLRIFNHAKACVVNGDDSQTFPDNFSKKLLVFGFNQSFFFGVRKYGAQEFLTVHNEPVIASSSLSLVGRHNVANVLASLALLSEIGVDYSKAVDVLKSYRGLKHCCQVIVDKFGIKWINNSKATNVAATLAALSGIECQGTLYLLLGGDSKGADLSELKLVLASLDVKLCCFGVDGGKFMFLHPSASLYNSMESIVIAIDASLKEGDVVMLSPSCSSLDQFKNFSERGEIFEKLAKNSLRLSDN
ncbi:UDP-N-acetylmuramoylalanine--D-glutamate ligase [Candidatus Photodesmus blepharus]|uniref:UDP-N-acetylmuramoylalanine--D-glutamate ligase n=1 Tax=Candidatus Photodesmus blepharonis TaxID=1179155 RepID=A0A084CMU6_9GAMM|nr:UDP-N-acetylmuramoyl-L-alanine--D-glutamate ligase [Candidatus Photodesmus blepharus]KEY91125.1 UDP-N-acetylmuramoylalanine--D-glutamate ligase [Candidatus Photodesmus blepharus]